MEYYNKLLLNNEIKRNSVLYHSMGPTGLGAILSRLMVGFNLSILTNSDYAYDVSGTYCIEKFFKPIFNKKVKDYQNVIEWNFFRDTWESRNKFVHMYPLCPIVEWQHLSRHQWNMLLAQAICGNPTERLEEVKNNFKNSCNWNSYDVHIGVHVRRGDKIDQNPYIPMSTYQRFLKPIVEAHSGKKIGMFVASDDNSTYEVFKNTFAEYPNVDILWDTTEKRYNNCNVGFVVENPEYVEQETETGCKIISLLGDCEYVVGMSSAQFTWIGGLLSSFKNGLVEHTHLMIDPNTNELGHWGSAFI